MRTLTQIKTELKATIGKRDNSNYFSPKFDKLNNKVNDLIEEFSEQAHISWFQPYRNKQWA